MRIPFIVVASGVACALSAFAATDKTTEFRFCKDLQFDGGGLREDILSIVLDSEVYGGTRPGCPDLRIFDKQHREIPYVLEKATESQTQSVWRESEGRIAALKELPDNRIEVVWELGDKETSVTALILESPLNNFEKRVTVYGVQAGKEVELVHEAMIYDYSRYMDVRCMEVALSPNTCRLYRIQIDDIVDKRASPLMELERAYRNGDLAEQKDRTTVESRPLRIDRIRGWHTASEERIVKDRKTSYEIVSFKVEQREKDRRTVVTVRARHEPLTVLIVETPDQNFSRSITLEAAVMNGVRKTWVPVAESRIFMVQFRSFHEANLRIEFPEQRAEEYRLLIRDADNPPLNVTGIRAEGNLYRLSWLSRVEAGTHLYYGSETANKPTYDTASVLAILGKGFQGLEGKAIAQQTNLTFKSSALGRSRFLESKGLFLAAVCLVVALLAWGLFCAGRKMEGVKDE